MISQYDHLYFLDSIFSQVTKCYVDFLYFSFVTLLVKILEENDIVLKNVLFVKAVEICKHRLIQ